jgi:hypothetical protein
MACIFLQLTADRRISFPPMGLKESKTSGLFSHSRLIFKGKALCLYVPLLQFRQVRASSRLSFDSQSGFWPPCQALSDLQ